MTTDQYLSEPGGGSDRETFTGMCRGGPKDGLAVSSRFPKGFLLADIEARRVWLYDRSEGGFDCRDEEPVELLDEGPDNRWRAADEVDYDVIAYDGDGGPDNGDGGYEPGEVAG